MSEIRVTRPPNESLNVKIMKTNAIKNKTRIGLIITKARGHHGGRHSGSYDAAKADRAKSLYLLGVPVKIICKEVYIARSTLYNYLRKEGVDHDNYIKGSAKIKYSHN